MATMKLSIALAGVLAILRFTTPQSPGTYYVYGGTTTSDTMTMLAAGRSEGCLNVAVPIRPMGSLPMIWAFWVPDDPAQDQGFMATD